ncbi:MAG: C10 family peptidase, partial [Prevotella sp.]|nr:C10 family peptidase [Prevotella sp.]
MKKTTITLMMFLASMLSLANPIGKQKAREYAQVFFNSSGREIVGEAQKAPGKMAASQDQPLYVFNAADNRGFVIIAGDDCIDPLLGYTETGSYNEDDMPDNFKFWMEMMVNAINALPSTVAEGQADKALRQVAIHNAIQPLIKTKWDQGSATASGYIYNTLTPTINSKHCLTGCVATAGAQVMYYYQHPKKATKPVPGYESNSTLGMLKDLPSIQFDWSQMKNTYSKSDKGTSSERAVSELMLYCGYAAYMDYGLYGSGANEYWMVQNMVELFDYDPYTWKYVTPSDYGVSEWDAMIYGELSSKRPVIFSGWGVSGAHAFLCDGYDGAGLYHFNWGWGGSNNGYFKLIEPNPFKGSMDNGYSMDVYATIGLQPNTGKTPPAESLVATTVDTWVDGTKISTWLTNDNPVSAFFGLGIGELKANGTINVLDTSYEYNKNYELKPMYWRGTFSFDVSSYGLSKGKHNLVFICIEKNAKQWVRCRPYMLYFEVTVKSDGSIEIIRHPLLSLEATSIDVKGNLFATVIQPVIVKVKSKVDDYTGPLYLFANTSNTRYNPSYYTTVAIEGGNTGEVELIFKPQTAGTYNLWVCTDEYGENVIGTKKVVIKPVPSYETKLTKLSMTVDCQPNTTATLQVKNETQYDYFDSFRANLYIYHDGDYSLLTKKEIYPILIKPGETKDIIETFGGLEPGTNYYIEFYYKPKVGKGFSSLGGKKFTIINPNQEVMELVDLGLSVKWCNMNVGASAPAYYGNYYAWGETATKSTYTWANYKHASGTANSVMSIGGNIAATTYDPAYRSNKNYCLPTKAQIDELLSKCTFKETIKNGMTGYIVTGPSGKSIFLPLGGYKADGKYNGTGEQAYFWAADVDASNAQKANALFLKTDGTKMTTVAQRRTGICIRAVEYKASTPTTETMELVDLGLSVKWCNMNLGATVSSGYGNYYAWGETTTKSNYTWANYKHASGTAASVKSIGNNIAATTYDAAYQTNKTYCLPTKAQINELLSKCTFKEGTKDGVKGYTVTGPSGKSIFLPLGGYKADGQYNGTAEQAYYWAADVDASNAQKANALFLKTATASKATVAQRRTGVCIRAVEYKASTPATETMELVDLGLSVKWCNMNLGASASSGYGNYYAWGETATKTNYTWANYKHASGTAASVKSIGNNIAATTYDAAYQSNKTYCLPTKAQIGELLSKCTFKEGTKNGV